MGVRPKILKTKWTDSKSQQKRRVHRHKCPFRRGPEHSLLPRLLLLLLPSSPGKSHSTTGARLVTDARVMLTDDSLAVADFFLLFFKETGPLAVCEGSARMKNTPSFYLILRLSGRQSERRGNNVMCSSTIIEDMNESFAKQLCMLFPIRVLLVDLRACCMCLQP